MYVHLYIHWVVEKWEEEEQHKKYEMRKMLFISKTSPCNMVQYENLDEKEIKKNKRKIQINVLQLLFWN